MLLSWWQPEMKKGFKESTRWGSYSFLSASGPYGYLSFAFFCCHLRYAGFGHINQKIAPHCSRGSSRKQFSHFLMWKLRGSAFCRNLSFCLLHVIYEHRDLIYTCCVFYDVRYFNKFYLCNSSSLPTCL